MKRIVAGLLSCLVLISVCVLFAQDSKEESQSAKEYTAESLGVSDMDVLQRLEAAYLYGTNPRQLTDYRVAWEILLKMDSEKISPEIDKRTPFFSVAALEHYILTGYDAARQMGNGKIYGDMETIRFVREILKKQEERKKK